MNHNNLLSVQNSLRDYFGQFSFAKPVALTLTLKQGMRLDTSAGNAFVSIDAHAARQNLRHFLNLLNAHYFGKGAKRFGKRIPAISVLEGTRSKRLHYHLLADWPRNEGHGQIAAQVSNFWGQTQWGYKESFVQLNADRGWINYITKLNDKTDLSSSIDWENCFSP